MPTLPYIFRVTEVVKVTDGDSYWLRVAVGFRQITLVNIRLSGYDCPERNRGSEREKAAAVRAQQLAAKFLRTQEVDGGGRYDGGILWVRTEPDPDNFGRWLGDVWVETGDTVRHLGAELREAGLASVWPMRWRDEYDRA